MGIKILISDCESRTSFDIYNILRANYSELELVLLTGDVAIVLIAVYQQKVWRVRKDTYNHFETDFLKVLAHYAQDEFVLLPIKEDTLLLFYEWYKHHPSTSIRAKLPQLKNFNTARNKAKLSKFCIENGIPVPEVFSYDRILELRDHFRKLIVKPKVSEGGATGIRYINRSEDLALLEDCNSRSGLLIQEQLDDSARIEGAFFLCDQGRVLSYYGHQRLRAYPREGGVTVYSKFQMNEETQQIGSRLLEKLAWSGVAMIEFLYDKRSGTYKVIELNARIWGSIMLSEFAGTYMIINYIRLALGQPLIPAHLRQDVFIRWLFPFDCIVYVQSRLQIKDFWRLDLKKTCYINFTYSTYCRCLMFLIVSICDWKKLTTLFRKLLKLW